jgi:dCMP deaminase
MNNRPSLDEWAMQLALDTALRSTCLRRRVGCVLLNSRGHVIGTGYNGVASGVRHCNEVVLEGVDFVQSTVDPLISKPTRFINTYPFACSGAKAPSGTNLEGCQAIHAEANALLQCRDVYEIRTCYVTVSPCIACVKLLMNTGCQRIVFAEPYSHDNSENLWLGSNKNRSWEQLEMRHEAYHDSASRIGGHS